MASSICSFPTCPVTLEAELIWLEKWQRCLGQAHNACHPTANPCKYLPQVSSNAGGVDNIKQAQVRNERRLLQEQREGLTNTTSSTANCKRRDKAKSGFKDHKMGYRYTLIKDRWQHSLTSNFDHNVVESWKEKKDECFRLKASAKRILIACGGSATGFWEVVTFTEDIGNRFYWLNNPFSLTFLHMEYRNCRTLRLPLLFELHGSIRVNTSFHMKCQKNIWSSRKWTLLVNQIFNGKNQVSFFSSQWAKVPPNAKSLNLGPAGRGVK